MSCGLVNASTVKEMFEQKNNNYFQHADEVAVMFSETKLENHLEHFGVKGMHWGERKERQSSGRRGRSYDNSVEHYTSNQRNISVGKAAAIAVIGGLVLRRNITKVMKVGNKNAIKKLKAMAKVEAKTGKNVAQTTARANYTIYKNIKPKTFGAKVGSTLGKAEANAKNVGKKAKDIKENYGDAAKAAKNNLEKAGNALANATGVNAEATRAVFDARANAGKAIEQSLNNGTLKKGKEATEGLLGKFKARREFKKATSKKAAAQVVETGRAKGAAASAAGKSKKDKVEGTIKRNAETTSRKAKKLEKDRKRIERMEKAEAEAARLEREGIEKGKQYENEANSLVEAYKNSASYQRNKDIRRKYRKYYGK